jgi:protein SPA2
MLMVFAVPHLPLQDDFHPKRNQAHQKMATLFTTRFEDFPSNVYFQLARQYPKKYVFHPYHLLLSIANINPTQSNSLTSPSSVYDDVPSPRLQPHLLRSPPTTSLNTLRNGRISEASAIHSGYSRSTPHRKVSEDNYSPRGGAPALHKDPAKRSTNLPGASDVYTTVRRSSEDTYICSISSRRKPCEDRTTQMYLGDVHRRA